MNPMSRVFLPKLSRDNSHGGGYVLRMPRRAFLFTPLKIMFQAIQNSIHHITKQSGLSAVSLVKKGGAYLMPSPPRPSLVQANDFAHMRGRLASQGGGQA